MGFDVTKDISHRDDMPWYDAPVPPVKHRCFPQTSGWVELDQWLRCPCGAIAAGRDLKAAKGLETYETDDDRWNGLWSERNSRSLPAQGSDAPAPATTTASSGGGGGTPGMPDEEPPIGWKQVASNYRDQSIAERRRANEAERKLARRSVDDVYLLIGAIVWFIAMIIAFMII